MSQPYGIEHLMDLKGCELGDLNQERLHEYLVKVCELIQMNRHGEPMFWEDDSGIPHLHGVSAVQFIETSTIVCHALPLLGATYLNIFSCKEFDTVAARDFSVEFWRAKSVVETTVTRS